MMEAATRRTRIGQVTDERQGRFWISSLRIHPSPQVHMKANRWLIGSGYLLALYLVFVPLYEATIAIWPVAITERAWRFGAVGLLSQAIMTPLLGALVALGIALYVGHPAMTRLIAVASAVAGTLALVTTPVFIWDGVRSVGQVGAAGAPSIYAATALAATKLVLGALICGAVTLGVWHAPRGAGGAADAEPESRSGRRIIGKA
jgi:hypothetical protein